MIHLYQQGTYENFNHSPVFVLFHGTGGNEYDLLPLMKLIDKKASILSLRGNVLEHGMPRFFRRLSEGVFDLEDLEFRTKELHEFLIEASTTYQFGMHQLVLMGYSNGANIIGSYLFTYGNHVKNAILFHPMVPRRDREVKELSDVNVFIGAGQNDPICPPQEAHDLQNMLEEKNAKVHLHWESGGHQLTREEVEQARHWFEELKNSTQWI